MRNSYDYTSALIAIQSAIYREQGVRTDVHYREGYGALIVPEGAPLTPANVIAVIDEMELEILALTRVI